jgi:hypothetical protein
LQGLIFSEGLGGQVKIQAALGIINDIFPWQQKEKAKQLFRFF